MIDRFPEDQLDAIIDTVSNTNMEPYQKEYIALINLYLDINDRRHREQHREPRETAIDAKDATTE
jgi:hypothetical protein